MNFRAILKISVILKVVKPKNVKTYSAAELHLISSKYKLVNKSALFRNVINPLFSDIRVNQPDWKQTVFPNIKE